MASKLLVAVALFAVCHGSPVDNVRDKRSYTAAIGSSFSYAGTNRASAVVSGDKADAQAINENSDSSARDALGNSLPSQAYAKVGHYDSPNEAVGLGYAQPAYYPLPAPATVVAYQKYAAAPVETPTQIVYKAQPAPALAQSSAAVNGGYGSAISNADTGFGTAASNAKAQGSGPSAVSALAQSDGAAGLAVPTVVDAKHQNFHTVYTPAYTPAYSPAGPNSASSSANVNGYQGSAVSAARTGAVPTRKSISWRFGTAYDQPAAYGAAKASHFQHGSAAGRSDARGQALSSAASTAGAGSAQAGASDTGYGSSVRSSADTLAGGSSVASADANGANYADANGVNYAALRSPVPVGYGNIKSSASSQNGGSAVSASRTDQAGHEYVDSASRSGYGGSSQAAAYNNGGGAYGFRSNGAWGGQLGVDSSSQGVSNAFSSARNQGLSAGYRVTNSAANSAAGGAARSNAYAQ